MATPPAPLTEEEKAFFLKNGYLKLRNCFTREQAAVVTEGLWARLGMSEEDRGTWTRWRTHMGTHREFDCAEIAPRAWAAICELCGGEDRVHPSSRQWRDSLIVNLGSPESEGRPIVPEELDEWHVDGDFFVHYLDSPEQALLVIPLFTDIVPGGGGTMLCPAGIPKVARWLYEHPDGVSPRMQTRSDPEFAVERNLEWYEKVVRGCAAEAAVAEDGTKSCFVEATGEVGDVYLLHPFMLHCATPNPLRRVRVITNPPVTLREPHRFDRAGDDDQHSLVELKTIRAILGGEGRGDRLDGWKITGPREKLVPQRIREQEESKKEEIKRLEEIRKVGVAA